MKNIFDGKLTKKEQMEIAMGIWAVSGILLTILSIVLLFIGPKYESMGLAIFFFIFVIGYDALGIYLYRSFFVNDDINKYDYYEK